MMLSKQIIQLLSHHRAPGRPRLPQSFARLQLLRLLRDSQPPLSPDTEISPTNLDRELQNLEAQGEVLLGLGKQVCMAQPMVLTDSEEKLAGLQFFGDRAYLRLAHQSLETGQPVDKTQLMPKKQNFSWIQAQLQKASIACLTVDCAVNQLPATCLPSPWRLQGQECLENPFFTNRGDGSLWGYQPSETTQRDRWQPINGFHLGGLRSLNLLRTPAGEFLWMENGQFFELAPDTACLAMFELDRQAQQPLRIAWDEQPGRLDLRGIVLPRAYAQAIWRLSQSDPDHNRIRLVVAAKDRPRVKAVLERLGCKLV